MSGVLNGFCSELRPQAEPTSVVHPDKYVPATGFGFVEQRFPTEANAAEGAQALLRAMARGAGDTSQNGTRTVIAPRDTALLLHGISARHRPGGETTNPSAAAFHLSLVCLARQATLLLWGRVGKEKLPGPQEQAPSPPRHLLGASIFLAEKF